MIASLSLAGYLFAEEEAPTNASPRSVTNKNTKVLPPVLVTEKLEGGNRVDDTVSKMPVSLHQTARSVQVVDAVRMSEQNMTHINSALAFVPGLFQNASDGARESYHFYARGFRQLPDNLRVDGFPGIIAGGDIGPNTFGVDKVVFLKGPAGLLYGAASAPGALVNILMKKPQAQSRTVVDFSTGGYFGNQVNPFERPSYALNLDSTGALNKEKSVLYRGLLSVSSPNSYTRDVIDRNYQGSASMTFRLDPEARFVLTPTFQIQQLYRPAGRGLVVSPKTSQSLADGLTEINASNLSPLSVNLAAGGRLDFQVITGADLKLKPFDFLTFTAAYRYIGYNSDINWFLPNGTVTNSAAAPEVWTLNRVQTHSLLERFNHGADFNALLEIKPADFWKNLFQTGVNLLNQGTTRNAAAPANTVSNNRVNVFTGATTTPLVFSEAPLADGVLQNNFFWNAYAQSQTSLFRDVVILTLGLGYGEQTFKENYDKTTNAKRVNQTAFEATRRGQITPSASVLFGIVPQWAVYASYSYSYLPQDGSVEDVNGVTGNFKPTSGANYEAGTKLDFQSSNHALSATLSVFYMTRDNVLLAQPSSLTNANGRSYSVQYEGGRISRGVELSVEARPIADWRIALGGAWIDARYRGNEATNAVADAPAEKTPAWSLNAWSRYDFRKGPLKGLGFSAAVIW
ncbi:MAG: TonB-dependent receptor, partial [Spirochaetia bacterium]|nr:TonB-dependent receptor [Spirochaetia bacterium]